MSRRIRIKTLCLATGLLCVVLSADATLKGAPLLLSPSESIIVSDATTTGSLGTVDTGLGNTYVARGRSHTNEDGKQIQTFIKFDLSGLTPSMVSDPAFSADFQIDYTDRLNTINGLQVSLGRNTSGSWDSSGTNNPLHDWGFKDEGSSIVADDLSGVIVGVLGTPPPVDDFTIDVTSTVRDWVNGVNPNDGFVLFYRQNQDQAGGFENAELILNNLAPEPSTFALASLGLLGLACFGWRKRK